MSKNELSPAKKGRVTKLSQKSVDELINIILRKDEVERKLHQKIDSVENEVKKIISANDNLFADYAKVREANVNKAKEIKALKDSLTEKNTRVGILESELINVRDYYAIFKHSAILLGCWAVIATLIAIFA